MDAVLYSDLRRRTQEEDAEHRRMEREELAIEGTPQAADWASLSSEVVFPCPGCIWTLIWAPYARWQEYGRGHDRRVGLRLVRRLRRRGFRARIVPSSAVESVVGQPSRPLRPESVGPTLPGMVGPAWYFPAEELFR